MDKRELRYGNLVKTETLTDEYKEVRYIEPSENGPLVYLADGPEHSWSRPSLLAKVKPIRLTTLILKELGFKRISGYWFINVIEGNIHASIYLGRQGKLFIYGHGTWGTKLEYLHQLQNLFFALAQKELDVSKLIKV